MGSTNTPGGSRTSSRPTFSCIRCIDRKVKCDRQQPCTACSKHKVECVFNPVTPSRKRQKRAKDQVLEDRLHRYETLLAKQGIGPDHVPDIPGRAPEPCTALDVNASRSAADDSSANPRGSLTRTQIFNDQGNPQFVHK